METWVQILALSLSPSLQRLKQRQHPSSLSPWSPCEGICRHSFGAKRPRTVAYACRSRYLLAPQVGKMGAVAWQSKGGGLAKAIIFRKALPQRIVGQLLPKNLCSRETLGQWQEQWTWRSSVPIPAVTGLGSMPLSQSLYPLALSSLNYPRERVVLDAACMCKPGTF